MENKQPSIIDNNITLHADWRSVKVELPVIIPNSNGGCSEEVLVWIETEERRKYVGDQRQVAYYTKNGWCYQYGDLMYDDDMKGITHWMPLPSSPFEPITTVRFC